jgi:hypothetical protein
MLVAVDLRDTVLEESAMHSRQAEFLSIWVISGPSDCNGFSLCQLECEVHCSRANRPGPMADSARDSKQLARIKCARSTLEFDGKPSFNSSNVEIRCSNCLVVMCCLPTKYRSDYSRLVGKQEVIQQLHDGISRDLSAWVGPTSVLPVMRS